MIRHTAIALLLLIFTASIAAELIAPAGYSTQFRDSIDRGPCGRFPLGTDPLGRDRLSRLLYGMRVSLLLAPAAALVSTALSAAIGIATASCGLWGGRLLSAGIDLVMSLPWLFLLLTVRALLPLNVSPSASIVITFALLGALGWASSARVVAAGVRSVRGADFVLLARASGCPRHRELIAHVLPHMRPLLAAQFVLLVPAFLIAEANLGLLGLGVAEPVPSLGNLLRELENVSALPGRPWLFAPAAVLVAVVSCFQVLLLQKEMR
jgi:ABC-type dipeptide/oligopeptide/nickel transport system permease subunit